MIIVITNDARNVKNNRSASPMMMEVTALQLIEHAKELCQNLGISSRGNKLTMKDLGTKPVLIAQHAIRDALTLIKASYTTIQSEVDAFFTLMDKRISKEISPLSNVYADNDIAMLKNLLIDVHAWVKGNDSSIDGIEEACLIYEYVSDIVYNELAEDWVKGLYALAGTPVVQGVLVLNSGYGKIVKRVQTLYAAKSDAVSPEEIQSILKVIQYCKPQWTLKVGSLISFEDYTQITN